MMMVVVCSDNCNRSRQVSRELELASEDGKLMLPFRIDNAPLKGAKKYYLKNRNWIDAFPKPEEHFEFLCQNVRTLLGIKKDNGPTDAVEQFQLGCRYETGDGVPKDLEQAVYWFRKSAEQGYAFAQSKLGMCYKSGNGVPKDLEQAVYWFRKSAEQGDAFAQFYLGICYQSGNGVPKDLEQAVKWYRKSAEQGNAFAQNNLGVCYEKGYGVPKDLSQAEYWYRKSAGQGDVDARKALDRLTK